MLLFIRVKINWEPLFREDSYLRPEGSIWWVEARWLSITDKPSKTIRPLQQNGKQVLLVLAGSGMGVWTLLLIHGFSTIHTLCHCILYLYCVPLYTVPNVYYCILYLNCVQLYTVPILCTTVYLTTVYHCIYCTYCVPLYTVSILCTIVYCTYCVPLHTVPTVCHCIL